MAAVAAVFGLLVSSTGSALLRKVLFQLQGSGLHHSHHAFVKPWFTTWESAAACWASLVFLGLRQVWTAARHRQRHAAEKGEQSLQQPLITGSAGQQATSAPHKSQQQHHSHHAVTWRDIGCLVLPAFCSVASMVLQGLGLQYISASTSLVLSGSAILFTAALSRMFLSCRLNSLHCAGIVLVLAGTTTVACANVLWPPPALSPGLNASEVDSTSELWQMLHHLPAGFTPEEGQTALGVGLTLLSMLLLAGRLVAEESLLAHSPLHALQVLGYEGLLGTLGAAAVGVPLTMLLPGSDPGGTLENWGDSFMMLLQTRELNIVNAAFFASVVGLNVFGVAVTCMLGSLFRAVLLTTRTALVWAAGIVLWKLHAGGGTVGEAWSTPTSELQLGGFALLLLGTFIYAQGSSHLAAAYQAAKACGDHEHGGDISHHALHAVPSVTRLRPYTSLYIPPSRPRSALDRPGAVGERRSLPAGGSKMQYTPAQAALLSRSSAPAQTAARHAFFSPSPSSHWSTQPDSVQPMPPVTGPFVSNTINMPASSPTHQISPVDLDAGHAVLISIPQQASHQSAPSFLGTLTASSSWIVPPHQRLISKKSRPAAADETIGNLAVLVGHDAQPDHEIHLPASEEAIETSVQQTIDDMQHLHPQSTSSTSNQLQSVESTGAQQEPQAALLEQLMHANSLLDSSLAVPTNQQALPAASTQPPQTACSLGDSTLSRSLKQQAAEQLHASPPSTSQPPQESAEPLAHESSASLTAQAPQQPHQQAPTPFAPWSTGHRHQVPPNTNSRTGQVVSGDRSGLDTPGAKHATPQASRTLSRDSDSRHSSGDSTSSLLGNSPTPAKFSELMAASRKQFWALPAFTEDASSSNSSDIVDDNNVDLPPPTLNESHAPESSLARSLSEPRAILSTGRRPSHPQAELDPASSNSYILPQAHSSSSPTPAIAIPPSRTNSDSVPQSPAAPALPTQSPGQQAASPTGDVDTPAQSSAQQTPFATLGQSPTPEVLMDRRMSRRRTPERLLSLQEEQAEADDGSASSDHASQHADASPAESSAAGSGSEAQGGAEPQDTGFRFSEELEPTPPHLQTTLQSERRWSQDPPPASPSASQLSASSTPRMEPASFPSQGAGLASLLGGSPFPAGNGFGRSKSGTGTPGTPMTPGQRIITQADIGRAAKPGLAGLLDEGPFGRPMGGRPTSIAAVARRLQATAQTDANNEE